MGGERRDRGEITPTWSLQPVVGVLHFCLHLINEISDMAQIKQQSLGNIFPEWVDHLPAIEKQTNVNFWLTSLCLFHNHPFGHQTCTYTFFLTCRILNPQGDNPRSNLVSVSYSRAGSFYQIHIWLFISGNLSSKVYLFPK